MRSTDTQKAPLGASRLCWFMLGTAFVGLLLFSPVLYKALIHLFFPDSKGGKLLSEATNLLIYCMSLAGVWLVFAVILGVTDRFAESLAAHVHETAVLATMVTLAWIIAQGLGLAAVHWGVRGWFLLRAL